MSTYYHHTDRESAKKIVETGVIKKSQSSGGDAVYGDGTYLTKKGPDHSKSEIAKNNYDGKTGFWEQKESSGKTDVAIEFKPREAVKDVSDGTRDIHLHKGDVKLNDVDDVKIHVRETDGKVRTYQMY